MKDSPGLHRKTYILILFMVLFAPIGNVLLKLFFLFMIICCRHWWGALRFTCNESGRRSSRLPARRAGSLCAACDAGGLDVDWNRGDDAGLFSLLAMLSIENMSFVVPVTALSYAAGAFGAMLFLHERISRQRWLGVFIVCVGVTLVWLSRR